MTKRHISLKDIAAELNLSISTVSRALKDHPDISVEVKEKVQKLAKAWKYRPNPLAMGLLKSNTRMIGVIVPNIVTHFFSSIISGIEEVAKAHNYYILISSSYESYLKEKQCVESMLNARVEGLIVCISQETEEYSHFRQLKEMEIPLIFFDRVCLTDEFSSVIADNQQSAFLLTEHFIQNGACRIAYLGGPSHLAITQEREAGYREALTRYGLPLAPERILYANLNLEAGEKAATTLLALSELPDALLGMNDLLTFAAMGKIKEIGLRIPQDIALAGYTDEFHSNFVEPRLTSVSHPTFEIGVKAAELLFRALKGEHSVSQVTCHCSLVVKESTVIRNTEIS